MSAHMLREQQRSLMLAIVDGAPAPGLRLRPGGQPALLSLYRHAYVARLAAALADNYLVLQRAMGDTAFDALAQAYLHAHPSRHASIRWFGEQLPDFMAQRDDLVPHPALVDLARMDWALRSAFDAADAPALSPQDAARLPADVWPTLTRQLHPSVRRVAMRWNVEPAWQALRAHEPDGGTDDEPQLPEPVAHPHQLLVWRQQLETRWRSLDEQEARLFDAAVRGVCFGELCELALEGVDDERAAAVLVVRTVQRWLGDGLVSGWSMPLQAPLPDA